MVQFFKGKYKSQSEMHVYRILKKYDYNENLTDEHFRVNKLRQCQNNDDDGWVTVKKVNKKAELEKQRKEERTKRREEERRKRL